jgi:lipopolysaccharide transport system ATP-binding protein
MKPIIKAANISKQFRITPGEAPSVRYETLRESLVKIARSPFAHIRRNGRGDDTIWALKDVNFEVMPGEVMGIIGPNGAGKSTLLKVLSRIIEPTSGRVELYGRVASLLEVGTGFHPDLSGRENVYLNGAILGMKRREIDERFDEIVAFAEVERFIDTAVKHYSSGMYLRLAFAVAAHLDPEILIVDEVLAVGDASFQKKCLGKMDDVTRSGRTVLLVTHGLAMVRQLCRRAILFNEGRIVETGPTEDVLACYDQMCNPPHLPAQV